MFALIYPQYGDFPDVEVKTFIQMVHEKRHMLPKNFYRGLVTLHDFPAAWRVRWTSSTNSAKSSMP